MLGGVEGKCVSYTLLTGKSAKCSSNSARRKEEVLRSARLEDSIERLGRLAVQHGADHLLVAGNVYDSEAPNAVTLRAPVERMKQFPQVQWRGSVARQSRPASSGGCRVV